MISRDEPGVEPTIVERVALGIIRVPLRTATLPPATRTNVYLIRGRSGFWVVDPGAAEPAENLRLQNAIATAQGTWNTPLVGCILTHHHPDHTSGLAWWNRTFGLPVVAEPRTITLVSEAVETRGAAKDTAWRPIAADDASPDAHRDCDGLRLVFTPGHAPGHFAVWTGNLTGVAPNVLLAGDLVAGLGTIVVNPPRGDMSDYITSLYRAAALGPQLLLPAHGPSAGVPGEDDGAVQRLRDYASHRLTREAKVLAGVPATWATTMEITAAAYDDVPAAYHVFAERSAMAHLKKLVVDGAVTCDGDPYAANAKFRRP